MYDTVLHLWTSYVTLYEPVFRVYFSLLIIWILYRYSPVRIPALSTILSVCCLNLTAVVVFPVVPPLYALFHLVRYLVNEYLRWKYSGKVCLMNGADAVWGIESFCNACNFTSLYVIEGECDLEHVRNKINFGIVERVINGEKIYQKLKWRAATKLLYPVWEKMYDEFDIANHVKMIGGRPDDSTEAFTESQVFEEISKVFDYPLSRAKPQWETLVVPNYVYDDPVGSQKTGKSYYALIFRIHHSIMDGVSAGFTLQNAIADSPPKLTINPLAPLKLSKIEKVLGYLTIVVFGLHEAVKSLSLHERNHFHGPKLTGPKTLGWSRPVSLDKLKDMKNYTKTSTTAVLMSALGGALRNLAVQKNYPVPDVIHSTPTVAILPYPNMKPQNRFTVVLLPMAIGIKNTVERIKSIHKSAQQVARSSEALSHFFLLKLLGQTPTIFCEQFSKLLHSTMIMSNVPGPAEKVLMFDGDLLVDVAFWTPLRNTVAISTSLFSYAGQVRVGMVCDGCVFPDSTDVPTLIREFEKEILLTAKLTGVPPSTCFNNFGSNSISSSSSSITSNGSIENNNLSKAKMSNVANGNSNCNGISRLVKPASPEPESAPEAPASTKPTATVTEAVAETS